MRRYHYVASGFPHTRDHTDVYTYSR